MEKKIKDYFNIKELRDFLDELDRPIAYRRILVDLTGSVHAALMLSQALYWQERAVQRDGWWYKSIEEWKKSRHRSPNRFRSQPGLLVHCNQNLLNP